MRRMQRLFTILFQEQESGIWAKGSYKVSAELNIGLNKGNDVDSLLGTSIH